MCISKIRTGKSAAVFPRQSGFTPDTINLVIFSSLLYNSDEFKEKYFYAGNILKYRYSIL